MQVFRGLFLENYRIFPSIITIDHEYQLIKYHLLT